MPRAIRETPIAMPAGIAVMQASRNAAKTRIMLAQKCSSSGRPPWISPFHASAKLVTIRSGVGRKMSRIHPKCVAIHQSAKIAATVTTLISVLGPSPGMLYPVTVGNGGAGGDASGAGVAEPGDAPAAGSDALTGLPSALPGR